MLQLIVDGFIYSALKFDPGAKWAQALDFFIYDSIKILLLLFILIFAIGVVRTFLPQRIIKQWMGKRGIVGNFYSALFGAVTPFCSCSSIPIFFGFLEAGIPLGVTFSFLITSPLINEYLVILMLVFFGWKITTLYVLSGMVIGIVSGLILGRMYLDKYLVMDLGEKITGSNEEILYTSFAQRVKFGWSESASITRKIWVWVLIGVGVGAAIHNYVPQGMVEGIIGKAGIFSVPIATIIGVPMYGSCAAIVPVAMVLFQKGFPLGTALSFMMAVAALSLPEAIMLRRAMHLKLIAIFFAVTTVAIIFTGYLFNFLQKIGL
ncbi:MAG: hypothetical protein AUJ74_05540 [Candidatus Omnitrophica bacterium CG1_02_44_16]|nr:MAG: hypothetical protein AUJ74_05540 [Candidatus Omnitrophica bacterium CG1_02_44_16]PIY83671.1 MAG: hypothetical protein COY78_01440 [Candidatus Omnitrophica bacterium CG_4_10_14_0_8_um_filter_44_12]PIZ84431.1 MAG: hypothetical protein COX96_03825 [Candidatus Omnitrophica bacterium CG_4_10_14_0_2_um_filter_44_9]